ncbi:cytochrome c [Chitinophaga terrae (ex Kim and Jung 2007)]|uniref:Cytochrome c n=1 Tax=Chitinophaga terrae (ex Kim and Jung 2007) TaxID=408074 RepID=A0A1H4F4L7_9BACT|nr:cytochrome c [Chitinophaga terrae (ex Kim and Jung 2007)]GEP92025.1 cytochrome c [Chitinophaga terrae (ex Kim and Jung 2007)]SEA91900.1 cytochrome c [Chitinophaga terrae (ex Kim and Jung 2007)]
MKGISSRALVWGLLLYACHTPDTPARFGFGRPASQAEIDSQNISIRPDGAGLPAGSGNFAAGRSIFQAKCASCHGPTGAEPTPNRLVAAFGDTVKAKTIGNYWPYATTIFDYIRRAMPFNAPGSLTNEEVYHLTAFLLCSNKIIDSTTVIDARSLPRIVMPAKQYYVNDDRKGGNEVK